MHSYYGPLFYNLWIHVTYALGNKSQLVIVLYLTE